MTRRVYLDTCCVIYLLEDVPPFRETLIKSLDKLRTNDKLLIPFVVSLSNHERNRFDQHFLSQQIRKHLANNIDVILCVSPLVRLESLVKPTIDGNVELMTDYEIFLADQQWLTIGNAEFNRALALRTRHKIKTPDALHLATAMQHGCTEFWTNDERLHQAATEMAVNIFHAHEAE